MNEIEKESDDCAICMILVFFFVGIYILIFELIPRFIL